MPAMTRRQRLTAIIEGRTPDRPAVKLWGAGPEGELLHPAYAPVRAAALALTDLMHAAGSYFHIYAGTHAAQLIHTVERPTASPEWVEVVTTFHTPIGDLTEVFTRSTLRKPGYEKEYLLKEPDDIRKLLAMPYDPGPFSAEGYLETDRKAGDTGIVLFWLDHPMYALQRLIGSENFAFWSLEARDLLLTAIDTFARRVRAHAQRVIEAGLKPTFAWVGPELCIPPLMSPADFDAMVMPHDQALCTLIHQGGGRVWVHCHGKMSPMLQRFVAMGVDVLNPIEPPPMGDVTVEQAFTVAGDRMALEGGIETHDFWVSDTDTITRAIRQNLDWGRGRRFILCPSSGYMEDPFPSDQLIRNTLHYVEEGVRYARTLA